MDELGAHDSSVTAEGSVWQRGIQEGRALGAALLETNGNRAAQSPRPRRTRMSEMCPRRFRSSCAVIFAALLQAYQEPSKRLKSAVKGRLRRRR